MTIPAKWRKLRYAPIIEGAIRQSAERWGLSPDHVLDLVDAASVRDPGYGFLADDDRARIDQSVRAVALEREDLRRPGSPLPFSPRELWDHWAALQNQGRHAEAAAFAKRHGDALQAAKGHVARETEAAMVARADREQREGRIHERIVKHRHWRDETKKRIDAAEATGVWQETGEPVMKWQLQELQTSLARHADALGAAERELAELRGDAQDAHAAS